MKNSYRISLVLFTSFFIVFLFSGCMDEFLNPTPKCSDSKVLQKLQNELDISSIYGTKTEIVKDSVLLIGINEETDVKRCRATVKYSLSDDKNDTVVSMINMMPMMGAISKEENIEFSLSKSKKNKNILINIID